MNTQAETIRLNGVDYAVSDGIVRVDNVNAWSDPIRTVGNQQRGDRNNASQWVMENWGSGLGFKTTRGAPPVNNEAPHPSYNGFFDSCLETRWAGQITLPGLIESVSYGTADATNDDYNLLFSAWEGNGIIPHLVPTDKSAEIAQVSFSTNVIDTAHSYTITNFEPRCVVNYKSGTYVFGGDVLNDTVTNHLYMDNAGSWSTYTPATTNLDHPAVSLIIHNDTPYAATVDNSTGIVEIETSSSGLGAWATISGLTCEAGQLRTANLISYFDAQGTPAMYLQTDLALYLVDITNSLLQKVLEFATPLSQGKYPNNVTPADYGLPPRPEVWNGNLYLPNGPSLIEYNFTGQWQEISPLVIGQMPPLMGESAGSSGAFIGAMRSTSGWLYVAFNGGNDGTTERCSIWAFDGVGFHYIWKKESASVIYRVMDFEISPGVEATDTASACLYVLISQPSGDNRIVEKVVNIDKDPLSITKKYAASCELITPWFDGGMTEVDTAILALGAGTAGLDTEANDNEKITAEIALNYSDTYESSASDIVFYSDSESLQKYASGAGLSAKSWRYRFTLDRGSTNTNTPVLYYPIAYYEKVFPDINSYEFSIDIAKTIQINQTGTGDLQDAQGVLRALKAAKTSVPLLSFSFPGTQVEDSETRYVRMVSRPTVEVLRGNSSNNPPSISDGVVFVRLEERL